MISMLLAPVLLHECDETGALSIAVIILQEINDVLGVVDKRGVVTATPGRLLRPAARLDHSIPALCCMCIETRVDVQYNVHTYLVMQAQMENVGSLAVCPCNCQIKILQHFLLSYWV